MAYRAWKRIFLYTSLTFYFLIIFGGSIFAQGFAKILIVGNFKSGKTEMCRVLRGLEYSEALPDGIRETCETFSVPEIDTTINLWDTIALDLSRSRVIALAKDANVVFILQDGEKEVTEDILKDFEKLYCDLRPKIAPDCVLIPVCTKADLKARNILRFSENYQKLEDLFKVMGFDRAFKISSKTGEGVREILDYLKAILPKMNLQKEIHEVKLEEDAPLFQQVNELKSLTKEANSEKPEKKESEEWYKKFKRMKV